jgi:hypothetical protein
MKTMEELGIVLKNKEYKICFNTEKKESIINFPKEEWHKVAKILHEFLKSQGVESVLTITEQ